MGIEEIQTHKAENNDQISNETPQWSIPIASEQIEEPGKYVLQRSPLQTPNNSLKQLRTIGKMIGFFVESLISQENGKLSIGSHCPFIFIYSRLLVFYLSFPVFFLACHLLITKSCHMSPFNDGEIDTSPLHIWQAY